MPALIPEDYLPDITMRLVLYKRIAKADSEEALREIQVEMIDRFGLLPEAIKNLFLQASVRVRARRLGIAEIEASSAGGSIVFTNQTEVNPLTLVKLVQNAPKIYGLAGANKLRFSCPLDSLEARRVFVDDLLKTLSEGNHA